MMLILTMLLSANAASDYTPMGNGMRVGGMTLAGGAGGSLVGGAVGLGLGSLTCGSHPFECWAPILGASIGGSAGFFSGSIVTAGWSAKRLELDHRRARKWSLITLGSGVGLYTVSTVTGMWRLSTFGAVAATLGIPVAAGIAAGTDSSLSVLPIRSEESYGLALTGSF